MFGSRKDGLIFSFLIGSLAAVGANAAGSCPNEWFTAEFVSIADIVVPESLLDPIIDSDLSFFKDIMLFTDKEIESVTQDAVDFFNTRFGLDFSQSTPDALGQRAFENATLAPFFLSPEIQYTITFNRWILNGKISTQCFENRDGGFMVSFAGQQQLFGSYGGEEGIPISPGDVVVYGFYNLPVYEQQPIVIQYNSGTPFRFEPVDGFGIINCELHHRILGEGVAQGVFRVTETGEDGMVHVSIRNLFTFPGHPGLTF